MQRLSFVFMLLCGSCDIFHSTDFSPCEGGGCTESGASDAGITPFTTDSTKALEYAKQTCAWIAACDGPFGANQTGKCIANAVLAFDKTTNPNRPPKGSARAYWLCTYEASAKRSCDAVRACTTEPPVECPVQSFVGCSGQTRVDCRVNKEIAIRENCRASGQGCVAQNGNVNALCVGTQGQMCGTSGCSGTNLGFCSDAGVDLGRDCATVGSGTCVNVFDAGACAPESSGTCAPSLTVTCDAGVAIGCQAGIPETVNCKTLAGGCAEGFYAPWDPPSSACVNLTPTCSNDTCAGTAVVACVRGRPMNVDCAALGLKPCTTIPTTPDGPLPACGKP